MLQSTHPLRAVEICIIVALLFYAIPLTHASITGRGVPQYIDEFAVPTLRAAPLAITVDNKGIVWFTESNMSKLGRFDPANQSFSEYSVPGTGDMWGIVPDHAGRIWITQYAGRGSVNPGGAIVAGGNGRLLVFDPKSNHFNVVSIQTNSSFPMRITVDVRDRVWFTEFLGNKIGMYDQSSKRLSEYQVPTNDSGPADITVDNRGALWFTEAYAQKVGEFFPTNQSFREYHLGTETPSMIVSSPVGIAVDAQGIVWVADHGGNWIVEFNPTTGSISHYPTHTPPQDIYPLSIPNGLLLDAHGRVWFSEHGGNSIAYYDPAKQSMVEFSIPTGPIATTLWIALAPNGDVWFTEWTADKIGVVHANLLIPFTVHLNIDNLVLKDEQETSLAVAANITVPLEGNGTWKTSWSSYNPTDISLNFSQPYPPLDTYSVATTGQLLISKSAPTGNYTLSVGLDAAYVRVWTLIPVEVLPSTVNNDLYEQQLVPISEVALLTLALAVILILRRKRLRQFRV